MLVEPTRQKNLKLSFLWSAKWGPEFFTKTMAREKFKQILRFIRFDKRTERSRRLQTNKFALVLEIWDKFIENSQALLSTRAKYNS